VPRTVAGEVAAPVVSRNTTLPVAQVSPTARAAEPDNERGSPVSYVRGEHNRMSLKNGRTGNGRIQDLVHDTKPLGHQVNTTRQKTVPVNAGSRNIWGRTPGRADSAFNWRATPQQRASSGSGAGYWTGESMILMQNGWQRADTIRIGDITHSGSAVEDMVMVHASFVIGLVHLAPGPTLTPGHPTCPEGGTWSTAGDLGSTVQQHTNYVFDLMLDRPGSTLVMGGPDAIFQVAPLGHEIGDEVLHHKLYSNRLRVRQQLALLPRGPLGHALRKFHEAVRGVDDQVVAWSTPESVAMLPLGSPFPDLLDISVRAILWQRNLVRPFRPYTGSSGAVGLWTRNMRVLWQVTSEYVCSSAVISCLVRAATARDNDLGWANSQMRQLFCPLSVPLHVQRCTDSITLLDASLLSSQKDAPLSMRLFFRWAILTHEAPPDLNEFGRAVQFREDQHVPLESPSSASSASSIAPEQWTMCIVLAPGWRFSGGVLAKAIVWPLPILFLPMTRGISFAVEPTAMNDMVLALEEARFRGVLSSTITLLDHAHQGGRFGVRTKQQHFQGILMIVSDTVFEFGPAVEPGAVGAPRSDSWHENFVDSVGTPIRQIRMEILETAGTKEGL
jgi:Hint-domain